MGLSGRSSLPHLRRRPPQASPALGVKFNYFFPFSSFQITYVRESKNEERELKSEEGEDKKK